MEAVNLLPAYARPGHPWASLGKDLAPRRVFTIAGAAACAVALVLGLAYVYEGTVVKHRRSTLADVRTQVAAADAKARPMREAQNAVAARMVTAATVSKNRIIWERLLRDISRVLPSQVYLQSLALQSPTPFSIGTGVPGTPSPAGSGGFTATGLASSHVRVADVLDRLASLPWLTNVTLVSSTNGSSSGGTSTTLSSGDTFSVSAGFDPTGGAK
jgi:Tfp pilus assembly protein PilN